MPLGAPRPMRFFEQKKVMHQLYEKMMLLNLLITPLPQIVFTQTASGDKTDLNTSVIYQNPGWPKVAGQGLTN